MVQFNRLETKDIITSLLCFFFRTGNTQKGIVSAMTRTAYGNLAQQITTLLKNLCADEWVYDQFIVEIGIYSSENQRTANVDTC